MRFVVVMLSKLLEICLLLWYKMTFCCFSDNFIKLPMQEKEKIILFLFHMQEIFMI